MKRKSVAVLYGGRSPEHEISIITALQLMSAIDTVEIHPIPVYLSPRGRWYMGERLFEQKFYRQFVTDDVTAVTILPEPTRGITRLDTMEVIPVDVCLLAFHGERGEDGCIQGLLELADLPYTGLGVLASALAMHKQHCKTLLSALGIPVLPGTLVYRHEAQTDLDRVLAPFEKYPLFVKPNHLGSSVGIGSASNRRELVSALARVFQYDTVALVEPQVSNLLEINVSILGEEASPLEIPVATSEMLTYEDKYLRGGKGEGEGMASLTRVIDPQDLDATLKEEVLQYAHKAYRCLECGGAVRFDFMVDLDTDTLYFNELNPIPGSLAFYLWEKANPPVLYTELINRLLQQAEEHYARRRSVQSDIGFVALSR